MPSLKVSRLFFDKQPVIDAIDKATRSALSKAGAFIRTRAKTSMRRRKRASRPGEAPSVHAGQLRDLTFFAYDPQARSVVVGPEKFRAGTAPRVLEEGGKATLPNGKQVDVAPRPFMGPALQAELPNLPSRWSGSVRT